ncbi:MAG: hypothetical protein JWP92_3747 [Caulobacter sp.]|nr:hypothetical protein [Caulobacter sp.]
MALGIPAFTTALGGILDQVHAGSLTGAPLKAALAALWTQYDSVLTLSDKIDALLAIKAAMIAAIDAIKLKGTIDSVSALPAEAEEGDAWKLVNIEDALDGHLFVRVVGIWTDLGQFRGDTGRSAWEAAVDLLDYPGTEAEYVARPLDSAELADAAAANADAKADRADASADNADAKADRADVSADNADAKAALAQTVVDGAATILAAVPIVETARDVAVAAADEAVGVVAEVQDEQLIFATNLFIVENALLAHIAAGEG